VKYDVCIIGSGAGGAPIAYELSNAGYKVVVLEKGPYYKEKDFTKDEIAVCRRDMYTPALKDEQHVINDRDKDGVVTRYEGAEANWSFWNGSMVGGSTNLMSGYFHRMKPNDFRLKSKYGTIKGANIVDWPISYDDLSPYYDKVEELIGVSGEVVKHKFLEPRTLDYFPYKSLETNEAAKWFDDTCKSIGYESIPTPRAILPKDALQRKGCSYSNFCGSYGCSTGAKGSARAALLQKCKAKIISDAFVYRLESHGVDVTKAHYYDKDKKSHAIEAKIFVVAAQAIETSRLLLNSKSVKFLNGLANNSNQVGKNLIFSAGGVGQGRIRFEKLNKKQQQQLMQAGLFFNRSLQGWYEFRKSGRKYKGGTVDFLFEHANIISRATREFYEDNELIWGTKLQEKMLKNITTSRVLTFEVFNDWLPTDYCNVTLDDRVKDKYGVAVAAINLYSHPHDIKVGKYLASKAKIVLKNMGAEDISIGISDAPPPNLVAGGCRFGINPKKSVLDLNCKAHELSNLYVTDGSFMPTGGSVPYTWTIYANSFRVADAILDVLEA
jgi:choline dehydrogenase-like flavoprotein